MKSSIYFLVSSLKNESPVKALIALANNLNKEKFNIYIVFFYNNLTLVNHFENNIILIDLSSESFLIKGLKLKSILNKDNLIKISISYGIIADFINLVYSSNFNFRISNIRGTLYELYLLKFGKYLGSLILFLHNFLIRNNDYIIVINSKIQFYYKNKNIGKKQVVFNNFINDITYPVHTLYNKDSKLMKFFFLGSLTKEKGFFILIDILSKLYVQGFVFFINILGSSSENKTNIERYVSSRLPKSYFKLFGHVDDPFKYVMESNYLIHPSYSEGTPRAVLESLHYGIPVIIRESVSNGLIHDEVNGFLFNDDDDLYYLIVDILKNNILLTENISIPMEFTKDYNVEKINEFLIRLK